MKDEPTPPAPTPVRDVEGSLAIEPDRRGAARAHHTVARIAMTAAIYAGAAGLVRMLVADRFDYPPLWPAAGLGLAALLAWGTRCWPGVLAGALVAGALFGDGSPREIVPALALAAAATLQAVVGAVSTRRFFAAESPLTRDGDLWQFLMLAGPFACAVGSTAGTAALMFASEGRIQDAVSPWLVRWSSDALGVLLFAPLALLWWPNLRVLRAQGMLRVALPLLTTAVLLAAGLTVSVRVEQTQAEQNAHDRMSRAYEAGLLPLAGRIDALQTVERLFAASNGVSASEFARFTRDMLAWPGLQNVQWIERVRAPDRRAFETGAQRPDGAAFRITERPGDHLVAASERHEYHSTVYIEPRDANASMLGFDHASVPVRREALQTAQDTASPVATQTLTLLNTGRPGLYVFVPVYASGFDAKLSGVEDRRNALRGFIAGAFDRDRLFSPLAEAAEGNDLDFRLSDVSMDPPAILVDTMAPGAEPKWRREIVLAGRLLRFEAAPTRALWAPGASRQAKFAEVASVIAAFLVVLAVLGSAGRNAAKALEVAHKTRDLQRELDARRSAENALRASETRYRRLIEESPYAVFLLCDGRFAYVNPKTLAVFGARTEDELVGRLLLDFAHDDGRATLIERMRRIDEESATVPPREFAWSRIDGTPFYGESTGVPYEHEGRRAALVMFQDVTARRLAEEQRDRFFDLSPDLFCIGDRSGYFTRVNRAFTQTLGWSEAELVASPFLDFVHPDDRAATLLEMKKHEAGEPTIRFENRYRDSSGGWHWLAWQALPQRDGLVYATARDVTAQREAARELEAAKTAAESASRAKSAFLAAMSHEIRTPMNGVVGMIDLLARTPLTEHQADMVRTVADSAVALLGIIDDILDFSKIEAGRMELDRAAFCLVDLVEGVCQSLVPVADRHGVDIDLFIDAGVPDPVVGDSTRVRQVLYNLVGNAIKFSGGRPDRRGHVSLRVVADAEVPPRVTFRIVDNGIGMSAETLGTLFRPFTQAEVSTTRRYGGTGLGLTISQRLVALMDGSLTVASDAGEGSTFTVTLPFEPGVPPAAAAFDLGGVRCVLVASGFAFDLADASAYLASAGAEVSVATTSLEAARLAAVTDGCVVVLENALAGARALAAGEHPVARIRNARLLLAARSLPAGPPVDASAATLFVSGVLRREPLRRAVAVASGRASPEFVRADLDRPIAQPGIGQPSIALARAEGRLILVAEDDAINQKVILRQLALLGHAAEVASNGAEALRMWRAGDYGLLLTDLHMPEMDGYTLTEEIRAGEPKGRRKPIIALTANALRGEANRAHVAGVDDYLTKPVALPVLRAALEKWLGRGPAAAPAVVEDRKSSPASSGSVDIAVLKRLVGDDDETVRALLADFAASVRDRWTLELREASAARDSRRIGAVAHKVKSAARSIGALALGDVCAELENACRSGNSAAIAAALPAFDRAIEGVGATVEHILEQERA